MFKPRKRLPRLKHVKDPNKRCGPILKAFKELNKIFDRYPYYVQVKKSTIKGAGKGVFATCDIPAGARLGFYSGKCYHPDVDLESAYLLCITSNGRPYITIDGEPLKQSNWTRFINCPENPDDANVVFSQYGKIMYIKSVKDIPAQNELFLWYGEEYVEEMLQQHFTGFKPRTKGKMRRENRCPRLNK